MTHFAYLSLGSNLGDRVQQLHSAIARLNELGRVTSTSSLYETEPVEFTDQPWFLNCAVALRTSENSRKLLRGLMAIERDLGRDRAREKKKGPRTLDIDILLFDDVILDSPDLIIPHPAMHLRKFVLQPLAEIAPRAIHPVLKTTIQELLTALPQDKIVRRIGQVSSQQPTPRN